MTKNKTEYTPTEALYCLDDVSRNAFYNDMQAGGFSYEKKRWGKKERRFIAGSELARFYANKFHPERLANTLQDIPEKQNGILQENIKTTPETNVLEPVVGILKEQLKHRDTLIEDLSVKLDKAYDTIHRQTLLLTDNRIQKPVEPDLKDLAIKVSNNENLFYKWQFWAFMAVFLAIILALAKPNFSLFWKPL